jgi:formate hydrogenlyase subunit 3/multisubunit Na+/H+ antiporter MnhD subunit
MNGTVISPPTVLFALFVVFTGLVCLASRRPLIGRIGTIGVTLLSLVAFLATTSDADWRQLLFPAHFDLLASPLALTSSVALLLTALFGILSTVEWIRRRSRKV